MMTGAMSSAAKPSLAADWLRSGPGKIRNASLKEAAGYGCLDQNEREERRPSPSAETLADQCSGMVGCVGAGELYCASPEWL